MSQKKVVVVDLDGVIVDFNSGFVRLLQQHGAPPMPDFRVEDPAMWHWFDKYGASEASIEAALAASTSPAFWGSLGRHRDFVEEVRERLCDLLAKHEVYFVTSRPKGVRDVTRQWLEFWLYAAGQPQVILTPTNKVAALLALEADVVIEDRRETLVDYRMVAPPTASLILITRAYNEGFDDGLIRVPSTLAALDKAKEILS